MAKNKNIGRERLDKFCDRLGLPHVDLFPKFNYGVTVIGLEEILINANLAVKYIYSYNNCGNKERSITPNWKRPAPFSNDGDRYRLYNILMLIPRTLSTPPSIHKEEYRRYIMMEIKAKHCSGGTMTLIGLTIKTKNNNIYNAIVTGGDSKRTKGARVCKFIRNGESTGNTISKEVELIIPTAIIKNKKYTVPFKITNDKEFKKFMYIKKDLGLKVKFCPEKVEHKDMSVCVMETAKEY
jgi:hypothetical protein